MKRQESESQAFTLIELLVVLAALTVLAVLLVPAYASTKANVARINCVNNLKQVGLAFRSWAAAHNDRYPMRVVNTEGGTAGNLANNTLIYAHFAVLSNLLSSQKVVICPADERTARTNFMTTGTTGDFRNNLAVSYFIGRDCDETQPQMFFSGDRNIFGPASLATANGGYGNSPTTVAGNLVALGTNIAANATTPGWTDKMHQQQGNVCRADGSVEQFDSARLRDQLRKTGDTTSPIPNVILFP